MLRAGHHGAALECEDWDRLITWIDLNKLAHGSWTEIVGVDAASASRRPGAVVVAAGQSVGPTLEGWPFDAAEARRRQEAGGPPQRTIDLGGGVTLRLLRIPAGRFVAGRSAPRVVKIAQPFWMSACEIDNAQFARFDPAHDSGLETGDFLQFSEAERGWPLNASNQPVVRVSWHRAMEFCQWLSAATRESFSLPDQMQWEYACRAGAATELWFGPAEADFAQFANLADAAFWRVETFPPWGLPSGATDPYRPAVTTEADGHRVSAPTGSFRPNAWGLYDMHGNVAEWTSSPFAPGGGADTPRVVRGGIVVRAAAVGGRLAARCVSALAGRA